jgi:hypothetical protein
MVVALSDIILFVTSFVCFLYGTIIARSCGKSCNSRHTPGERIEKIFEFIPLSILIYFFGFVITSKYFFMFILRSELKEFEVLSIIAVSLINALLASGTMAWLAMPKRRRLF